MADTKISAETERTSPDWADDIPVVASSTNYRVRPRNLAKLFMPHAGYRSGIYYPPLPFVSRTSATAVAADTHYAHPVIITRQVTIQSLFIRVGTGVSGNWKGAVYSTNGSFQPGTRLAVGGAGSTTSNNTTPESAISGNVTLDPGLYWFSALFDAAPTPVTFSAVDAGAVSFFVGGTNGVDVVSTANQVIGYTGTATYAGGAPDPFGTATQRTSTGLPIIGFRVA